MQCKNHPDVKAEHFCASCNAPICRECAEEVKPGVYSCFHCAMLQSVSQVGTSLEEKRKKSTDKKKKSKPWGPFHYFLGVSSVLIVVMWGVIIFGGQQAPQREAGFAKKGRVLLFMVNGALKRYAHYEGDRYPQTLSELVPKYLSLAENERHYLKDLSYQTDPKMGYRLSLAQVRGGEMKVVISPKGIESMPASGAEAK
jgi:hypothetical protein